MFTSVYSLTEDVNDLIDEVLDAQACASSYLRRDASLSHYLPYDQGFDVFFNTYKSVWKTNPHYFSTYLKDYLYNVHDPSIMNFILRLVNKDLPGWTYVLEYIAQENCSLAVFHAAALVYAEKTNCNTKVLFPLSYSILPVYFNDIFQVLQRFHMNFKNFQLQGIRIHTICMSSHT
jgi:hypothetical protein